MKIMNHKKSATTRADNFETRLTVLRHIAASHPKWVGRTELSEMLKGSVRTHQRALQGLVSLGYLECDRCNPMGYRLVKGKFEEFQGL